MLPLILPTNPTKYCICIMHEPLFQRIYVAGNQSYNVLKVDRPYFVVPWHFHPEIELMLVVEGEGTRFVGDSIDSFGPGDLVLVGANLSHVWKNGPAHYQEPSTVRAKAKVILFRNDCFGWKRWWPRPICRQRSFAAISRAAPTKPSWGHQRTARRVRPQTVD